MGADCIGADRIASPTKDVSRRTLIAGAVGALAAPIASPALLVPSPAQARGIAQGVQPDDELFMRMAIAEAARGDYPFGSVIVRDRKVMAKGRNLGKQEKDPTAPGEMVAIRHFLARYGPDKLKGTTLYGSGESFHVHGRDPVVRNFSPGLRRLARRARGQDRADHGHRR
jgi:Cytidine and deoxycytidylate deaminase zinc-binding region